MDIRTKVTNFSMNDQVAAYLDERLHAVERHLGADADRARLEVEVGREAAHSKHGDNWFAEIQVRIPGGEYSRVRADAETVQAAIDEAKDEILRKLRTKKEERVGFLKKIGAKTKDFLRGIK